MTERDRLLEKLRRIEALFSGAASDGERAAADAARQRIAAKLQQTGYAEPPIEMQFSMNNTWSRNLFVALARRYGLRPYRYPRQRYTTVMLQVPRTFLDSTLWPEFCELDRALTEHLSAAAEEIIRLAIAGDTSEAEVVSGLIGAAGRA